MVHLGIKINIKNAPSPGIETISPLSLLLSSLRIISMINDFCIPNWPYASIKQVGQAEYVEAS
jgi:hypothetical protein